MNYVDYSENIYSYPEKSGLEIIASGDIGEMYEFAMIVVWRDVETGELLVGADSGCSCPSPFETQTRESLTSIRGLTDLVDYARNAWNLDYYAQDADEPGYYADEHSKRQSKIADLAEALYRAG